MRIVFSAAATADARDIGRFGSERFGERGRAYVRELRAACKRLSVFPEMAPIHPTIDPLARVLHHRSHRVFYRVERDCVLVLRILHSARDTPTAL